MMCVIVVCGLPSAIVLLIAVGRWARLSTFVGLLSAVYGWLLAACLSVWAICVSHDHYR